MPRKPLHRARILPKFTIHGVAKHKIWTPGVMRPELTRHMIPQIRRLIGLWSHPGQGVLRSAELCDLTPGEYIYLNRALRSEYAFTQFYAVRFCLENGLPASAWVEFPANNEYRHNRMPTERLSIKCRKCGMDLVGLPCVRCWNGMDDDPHITKNRHVEAEPVLTVPEPTDAIPGSREKVEILRQRCLNNQELWHPDDSVKGTHGEMRAFLVDELGMFASIC